MSLNDWGQTYSLLRLTPLYCSFVLVRERSFPRAWKALERTKDGKVGNKHAAASREGEFETSGTNCMLPRFITSHSPRQINKVCCNWRSKTCCGYVCMYFTLYVCSCWASRRSGIYVSLDCIGQRSRDHASLHQCQGQKGLSCSLLACNRDVLQRRLPVPRIYRPY